MKRTIAIAGKGGTGKTTISGLIIDALLKFRKPILAIDADPNTNLSQWLGIEPQKTLGDISEEVLADKEKSASSKREILTLSISKAIYESAGFDFLAMGRSEGPGCYCYLNSLLRSLLDEIGGNYDFIVMDSEAGLEHISRKTTGKLDSLLLVSDGTRQGILTAKRIGELAKNLDIGAKEQYLVLNRTSILKPPLKELIEKESLKLLSVIPDDEEVFNLSEEGKSLKFLRKSSPVKKEVEKLVNLVFNREI